MPLRPEKTNQLVKIPIEVDADLEMAEIHRRIYEAKGPAILFERIKNSPFRALSNLYGTTDRTDFLFRSTIESVQRVIELKAQPDRLFKKPLNYWHPSNGLEGAAFKKMSSAQFNVC